jgi:hypothetical protein
MVPVADNTTMYALLIIPALVLFGFLSVRYGVDSRPTKNTKQRSNF